jgi:hypothetical protein
VVFTLGFDIFHEKDNINSGARGRGRKLQACYPVTCILREEVPLHEFRWLMAKMKNARSYKKCLSSIGRVT